MLNKDGEIYEKEISINTISIVNIINKLNTNFSSSN